MRKSGLAAIAAALPVAATIALAGCTNWTNGRPVAEPSNPTEPTFPTPRPSRTPPTTSPTTPSSTAPTSTGTAPGGETLEPDEQGYVYIETKSGKTRCQISQTSVGCEAPFTNPPDQDGIPANGVTVAADGRFRWLVGNLGDISPVTLDYRTYQAQGWTIAADASGTRFTNRRTGHGMFVSIENVESF